MNDEPVLSALGELIVIWNTFEDAMAFILKRLLGQSTAIDAIVAEMGPVSLCYAIKAASAVSVPDNMREHIEHVLDGFERYRQYRNYYIHGIRDTSRDQHDVHAKIRQTTGKGKLRIFEDKVGSRAISRLSANISEWTLYALLLGHEIPKARAAGRFETSLDKLPLPDELRKRPQAQQPSLLRPLP